MSNIINVIFNSNYKTSGTNGNAYYFIDWSAILKDNQKYTLSWTYLGQQNTFTGASKLAALNINLFAVNFMANERFGASVTQNIGNLLQNGYLYADTNFNTPILLMSRPNNNNVNVQILNNDNPPTIWTDNATIPVEPNNYILTLTFTEVN